MKNSNIENIVFLRIGNVLEPVDYSNIVYITSEGNYSKIQTDTKNYVVKISLTKILEELPKNIFKRVQMRFLVNLGRVTKIDLSSNKIMIDDKEIVIGPTYKTSFLKDLNRL